MERIKEMSDLPDTVPTGQLWEQKDLGPVRAVTWSGNPDDTSVEEFAPGRVAGTSGGEGDGQTVLFLRVGPDAQGPVRSMQPGWVVAKDTEEGVWVFSDDAFLHRYARKES